MQIVRLIACRTHTKKKSVVWSTPMFAAVASNCFCEPILRPSAGSKNTPNGVSLSLAAFTGYGGFGARVLIAAWLVCLGGTGCVSSNTIAHHVLQAPNQQVKDRKEFEQLDAVMATNFPVQ